MLTFCRESSNLPFWYRIAGASSHSFSKDGRLLRCLKLILIWWLSQNFSSCSANLRCAGFSMSEMIFLTDLWTLHWVVFFCCAHDWPHVWLVVSVSAIRCKCTDKTTQEMTSWSRSLLLGYNRCDHTLVWIKHKLLDIVLFYVDVRVVCIKRMWLCKRQGRDNTTQWLTPNHIGLE